MKKSARKSLINHVNIRLDDPTHSRMVEISKDKNIPLAEAIRISLSRTPGELQNEIQSLKLEMKEVRFILKDVLPQLSTKKEADDSFMVIARMVEAILKKVSGK